MNLDRFGTASGITLSVVKTQLILTLYAMIKQPQGFLIKTLEMYVDKLGYIGSWIKRYHKLKNQL